MIIGLGLGIPFRKNYAVRAQEFTPQVLFGTSDQGVWYDPSDFKPDWRYNLLSRTEEFDNAVWVKSNATVTANAATAPNGTNTADLVIPTTASAEHYIDVGSALSIPATLGVRYKLAVSAKAGGYRWLRIAFNGSITPASNRAAWFDLQNGVVGTVQSGVTATITAQPNGNYLCSIERDATASLTPSQFGFFQVTNADNFAAAFAGDGTSGIYIWGASLTTAENADKPYQKITDGIQDYYTYQAQPVLFQDSGGTTPVTALEQPVELMLDKSKGLVLGPEVWDNAPAYTSGWVYSNGTWTLQTGGPLFWIAESFAFAGRVVVSFDLSISSGSIQISSRGPDVAQVAFNSSGRKTAIFNVQPGYLQNLGFVSVSAAAGTTISNISVKELPGNHATQPTATSRPVVSARVNQYLSTETLSTQNVTTVATSYTLRFEGAGTVTLSGTATGTYSAGTRTITCTAGTLTSTVAGSVTKADLRVANDGVNLPPYQRVNTATDYDSTGFPVYLRADGVDDGMVTNSIDFTATDKMTVVAGARKLSDGANGKIVELGPNADTTNSTFQLEAPSNMAFNRYIGYSSRGTITQYGFYAIADGAAPKTTILAGISDIAGDSVVLRKDGSQVAQSTGDQGTGNFGNYPLYLFRRGGTTLPFNGRFYGLTIVNKLLSTTELALLEEYTNGKTQALDWRDISSSASFRWNSATASPDAE